MTLPARTRERMGELKLREAAETLAAVPGYSVGWVIGKTWWLVRYIFTTFAVGFEDGNK